MEKLSINILSSFTFLFKEFCYNSLIFYLLSYNTPLICKYWNKRFHKVPGSEKYQKLDWFSEPSSYQNQVVVAQGSSTHRLISIWSYIEFHRYLITHLSQNAHQKHFLLFKFCCEKMSSKFCYRVLSSSLTTRILKLCQIFEVFCYTALSYSFLWSLLPASTYSGSDLDKA